MSHRIFVYGTLRRGQPNHYLLDHLRPERIARTEPRFTLVSLGAYPAMVSGGQHAVVGELYTVDRFTLAALDHLEGHPHFYRRQRVPLDDGEEVETYLLPAQHAEGHPHILSGDWVAYRERGGNTSEGAK